jgi:hypothetical protein
MQGTSNFAGSFFSPSLRRALLVPWADRENYLKRRQWLRLLNLLRAVQRGPQLALEEQLLS